MKSKIAYANNTVARAAVGDGGGDGEAAGGLGVAGPGILVGRHHLDAVGAGDAVVEALAGGGVGVEAVVDLTDEEDVDAVVAGEVDGVAILAGRGDRTAGEGDGAHRVEERVVEVDIHRAAALLEDGVGGVPAAGRGEVQRGAVGGGGAAGGDNTVDLGIPEDIVAEGGHRGAAEFDRMDGTTIGTGKCGRPHRLQRGAQRDAPGDWSDGGSGSFGKSLLTNTRAAVAHPEIRA